MRWLNFSFVHLVTDPALNRIVNGSYKRWIRVCSGRVTEDKLNRPQGIDWDSRGISAVAGTGNNRVLVLELRMDESPSRVESGPADPGTEIELRLLGRSGRASSPGLSDVAWDDRGPFRFP
jgi:hypothetical protein